MLPPPTEVVVVPAAPKLDLELFPVFRGEVCRCCCWSLLYSLGNPPSSRSDNLVPAPEKVGTPMTLLLLTRSSSARLGRTEPDRVVVDRAAGLVEALLDLDRLSMDMLLGRLGLEDCGDTPPPPPTRVPNPGSFASLVDLSGAGGAKGSV